MTIVQINEEDTDEEQYPSPSGWESGIRPFKKFSGNGPTKQSKHDWLLMRYSTYESRYSKTEIDYMCGAGS